MAEIDLRSDTVTRPGPAMRAAMAAAAVGDDVYGEDPTAQRLQRRLADDDDPHFARTRLLALENTRRGRVVPQGYIVAAAALYALDHQVARLADDHARAAASPPD